MSIAPSSRATAASCILDQHLAELLEEVMANHALQKRILSLLARYPDGLTAEEIYQRLLEEDRAER